MKNLTIVLFLFMSFFGFGQNEIIGDFYDQYKEVEEVTDVKLQGWLLKLASEFSDEKEEERVLNNISFLRILLMSEGNVVAPKSLKQLIKDVKKDNFEQLIQIRNEGSLVDVYIREKDDHITDVLALINDPDDAFILLSVEGHLKFSDLNNLHINVEGIDHLKKIPETREEVPRA